MFSHRIWIVYVVRLVCGLMSFDLPLISPADEPGYRSLFNQKDLSGWEGDTTLWKVEDQALVGDSAGIKQNQFLCTKAEFGDFELKLEFRVKDGAGNTGVQFRTQKIPNTTEVSGYQADIGEKYWGCLYDESRRNQVLAQAPPELENVLKKGDWNEYTIRAEGDQITLKINGLTTVDYKERNAEIPRSGIIALQVHSGGPMRVDFRNIRLKPLGK
ncbi:MAG: DUF1080 domain-containing protein [Planctomycetales bacterium]|nr:DUF1080 domain-containing protein [Planctomycetales bacterium]